LEIFLCNLGTDKNRKIKGVWGAVVKKRGMGKVAVNKAVTGGCVGSEVRVASGEGLTTECVAH